MRFGSLFAGIGGLDLGFEAAGMECAFQVEWKDYPIKVLEQTWPGVPRWRDIREVNTDDLPPVDLLCGGFPCQPHSLAGLRKASEDERDLWSEFVRIIRATRPRWVVAENVTGLLSSEDGRFFGRVLRDLAALGFDAEWDGLPASAFGAYHDRDRIFIVAYPKGEYGDARRVLEESPEGRAQLQSGRLHRMALATRGLSPGERLESEPGLARLVGRVPNRTHRLEGVGNCVDPRVAEWLGRRIVAADRLAAE